MAYKRKTRDEFNVQGNYGGGWEDVCCEETRKQARERLKEYRLNEPQFSHRLKVCRVRLTKCDDCKGSGVRMAPLNIKCDSCNGTGRI